MMVYILAAQIGLSLQSYQMSVTLGSLSRAAFMALASQTNTRISVSYHMYC